MCDCDPIFLVKFRIRTRYYPEGGEVGEFEHRIVRARNEWNAMDKLEEAVNVSDPYGVSKMAEDIEVFEMIK